MSRPYRRVILGDDGRWAFETRVTAFIGNIAFDEMGSGPTIAAAPRRRWDKRKRSMASGAGGGSLRERTPKTWACGSAIVPSALEQSATHGEERTVPY